MIKYFFAALTIPDKEIWVNLSSYEKDRMVPVSLGQTALGRDLLAQDYMLKQLTASLNLAILDILTENSELDAPTILLEANTLYHLVVPDAAMSSRKLASLAFGPGVEGLQR